MGKNRDRLTIVAAILEAANSGSTKTRIMYGANLSFSLLEKYLQVVTKAGFLKVDGHRYNITEHGRDFLKNYAYFHKRYDEAKKVIDSLEPERERLAKLCERSGFEALKTVA